MKIETTSNAYFVASCWNYFSSNLLPTIRFYCISYVISSDYKFRFWWTAMKFSDEN